MGAVSGKLRTLLWYARRPGLLPHLVSVLAQQLFRQEVSASHRENAQAWCQDLAVDTNAALTRISGQPPNASLEERFADTLCNAREVARNCPVAMGGAGNLDLLYWTAEHLEATSVIETGVAFGWSSLAILLSLTSRPGARLISTDMPYLHRENDRFVGCVVPTELEPDWTLIRLADRQALPRAVKLLSKIDMCHYDSDKSPAGRRWAYQLLWQVLRPGGTLISDDVGDNLAFRDFCLEVAVEPIVVRYSGKYAGVLVKPS